MAAAWFNKICDRTKARAISAGTQPGERVHLEVLQVMSEEGIDLAGVKPQFLSTELAQQATLLVTMGCGDACPYVPGLQKLDWPLQDPKGQPLESVRKIRDEIRARNGTGAKTNLDLEPQLPPQNVCLGAQRTTQ